MPQFLNHLAHYAIGFYVGVKVAQRDYAPAAFAGAFFGVYQVVEAWRKKDEGYPEIKEGGIGFALGVACYRGYAIFLRRTVLSGQPNQNAKLLKSEAGKGIAPDARQISKENSEDCAHGESTDIPEPSYSPRGGAYETVCACVGGSGCGGGAGIHCGANDGGAVERAPLATGTEVARNLRLDL